MMLITAVIPLVTNI